PTMPIAAVRWAIRSSKVVSGERSLLKRLCRLATCLAGASFGAAVQVLPRQSVACAMPRRPIPIAITAGNVLPGLGARARTRHDGGLGVRDGCGHRAAADAPRGAPRAAGWRGGRQTRP